MRIGVNCLRIYPWYNGGVTSFTLGLLDGFAANPRGHKFVIFVAMFNREMFARYEALPDFRLVQIDEITPRLRKGPVRWLARKYIDSLPWPRRRDLPWPRINRWINARYTKQMEKAADVIFTPYVAPLLFPFPDVPTLYAIHDLQHVHFPEFFTEQEREERDLGFANTVAHAALIQASSRQMHDEFLAHFSSLSADRVVVIPEGVDTDRYARVDPNFDVRAHYGLPERFIFYPAQLWHHKNHITILKALMRLKQQGLVIPAVLTGKRYSASQPLFDFIEQTGLSGQVFHLDVVPYEHVIALHHVARFLVTASLYEAGSIPMREAAAAGTPIIGSMIPSHIEHSQEWQMQLFPPTDDVALAAILKKVWEDDALIEKQVEHNKIAIQNFTWNRAAELYLDAFENYVRKKNGV
jgi:glycosyltransferase involved in cell wall biosynthesis